MTWKTWNWTAFWSNLQAFAGSSDQIFWWTNETSTWPCSSDVSPSFPIAYTSASWHTPSQLSTFASASWYWQDASLLASARPTAVGEHSASWPWFDADTAIYSWGILSACACLCLILITFILLGFQDNLSSVDDWKSSEVELRSLIGLPMLRLPSIAFLFACEIAEFRAFRYNTGHLLETNYLFLSSFIFFELILNLKLSYPCFLVFEIP